MRGAHMIECCVAGSAHRGEMVLYPLRKLWLKRGARPLDEQRMLDMLPSVAIWQTQPVVSVKRRYKETPFFYKMEWFITLSSQSAIRYHSSRTGFWLF